MASVESTTGSDEEEWPPSFYSSSQQSLPVAPTKTGWWRLLVCIGIKIFGKEQQDACDAVGISRSMFSTGGWLQRFNRRGALTASSQRMGHSLHAVTTMTLRLYQP